MYSSRVSLSVLNGLNLSLVVSDDFCNLFVGAYSEEYTTANINVEIRATDQNGNGLTTVISEFDLRLTE